MRYVQSGKDGNHKWLNQRKTIPQTEKEKADAEYLRQLEEENLRLRIENAYLKELRRLRLEDEAKNGRHG